MSRFSCFTGFTGCRFAGRVVNHSIIRKDNRLTAVLTTLFTLALILLCSCSNGPDVPLGPVNAEFGMLVVSVRMVNQPLKKVAARSGIDAVGAVNAAAQTVAENLVVEISGGDLSPTQFKLKLDPTRPTAVDTVKKVPIGEARRISVWAVNKNGERTHIDSIEYRHVNIEKAKATKVYATLIPAAGSVYLHIYGLETAVSTVHASFTSRDGESVFQNNVKRDTHTFLSIDNIPHELDGILRVSLVDAKGDTVKVATNEFVFNARGDNTIELQFIENSGMLGMDATLYAPGVTMLSYEFGKSVSDVAETGELIITEIMFSASDDNYIELYNPKGEVVSFDTLTTEVDKTSYYFTGVSIGPNGYFVISRKAAPYADIVTNTTSGLPIVATGNWITVRRGKSGAVLDRVICGGANTAIGWPAGVPSGSKKSVELRRDKYGAAENNFGKNWTAADQLIAGTSNMYGTPGK
jgi:hypothetical protein